MPRRIEEAGAKAKQVGGTVVEKTKQAGQDIAAKVQTIDKPGRAEEVARSSGETLGKGLRKIANVIGELTAGFSRGIRPNMPPEKMMEQRSMEEEKVKERESQ